MNQFQMGNPQFRPNMGGYDQMGGFMNQMPAMMPQFPMMGNPMMGNPMMGNPMMVNPMMGMVNPMMGQPIMGQQIIGQQAANIPSSESPIKVRTYIN
jgi:hypothetical protein